MAYCTKCGKQNSNTAKFCTGCGIALLAPVSGQQPYPPPKTNEKNKKTIAGIIVMVALGICVVGYFIFFNKKADNSPSGDSGKVSQFLPGKYPFASHRILIYDDIKNLSQYDLRIMRNEIYARHGYIFQNNEMKYYFTSQSWYSPKYNDVNFLLSATEKYNIDFIKQYESYSDN